MKTALRLAAIVTALTLAPASFGYDSILAESLDASSIAASPSLVAPPAAAATSVPEPAAIAPVAGAIIVALRRRRQAA